MGKGGVVTGAGVWQRGPRMQWSDSSPQHLQPSREPGEHSFTDARIFTLGCVGS